MIAAVYARKSNEQEKGATGKSESVERQLEHGRAFAESRGWTVAHEFSDDKVSGATYAKLEGRKAMMEAAESGAFQILAVSEQSRLGRHMIESSYAIMQIADCGVRLFSYLSGQEIKVETTMDQAQVMLAGFAGSAERKAASDRSRDKAVALANAGLVSGGRCYGYDNVQGQGGKVRTINQAQAAVLNRIFQTYAGGSGHKTIRDLLNAERVKGPRGKWTTTGIRDILSNPAYTGVVTWGKFRAEVRRGRTVNVPRPDGEWITREIPGMRIIDNDLWKAVQARREERRHATPRGRRGRLMGRTRQDDLQSTHMLSGFLSCAVCGGALRIDAQVRRGRLVRGFVCAIRHTRGPAACANGTKVNEKVMDSAVLEAVARALAPEQLEVAIDALFAERREQNAGRDRQRAQLARDLQEADRRIANLVEYATRGDAPEPIIEALRTERDKQKALRAALDELEARPQGPALWIPHEEAYRAACRERVADVLVLLDSAKGVGPARAMLRRALAGTISCVPEGNGFRFSAPLDLGRLIEGTTSRIGETRRGTSTCRGRDGSPGG